MMQMPLVQPINILRPPKDQKPVDKIQLATMRRNEYQYIFFTTKHLVKIKSFKFASYRILRI
jgi:hypothetical protein